MNQFSDQIPGLLVLMSAIAVLYGFFHVSAAVIVRSQLSELRKLGQAGERGVSRGRLILLRAGDYLFGCHVGLYLTAIIAGFGIIQLFEFPRHLIPAETQPPSPAPLVWYGVELIAVLFTGLIALGFGQIAKGFAFLAPERALCMLGGAILITTRLLAPIIGVVNMAVRPILALFGVPAPIEKELAVHADDICELVERSADAGIIAPEEERMVRGVFGSGDTVVRDVMTPRGEVIALHEDATIDEVRNTFMGEGVSRAVVYGKSLDDIRGILLARDLLTLLGTDAARFSVSSVMRPAYFVATSMRVGPLLADLQSKGVHLAVVLDEHGGMAGVITIEDILEEIVGEIQDEFDLPEAAIGERRHETRIDGGVSLEELGTRLKIQFPQGPYDTIAGFIMYRLGSMPHPGEALDFQGIRFVVDEIVDNRIVSLCYYDPQKVSTYRVLRDQKGESKNPLSASKLLSEARGPRIRAADVA